MVRDLIGLAGLGCLAGGCYLVYPPLSLIVTGVVLLSLAVAGKFIRGSA